MANSNTLDNSPLAGAISKPRSISRHLSIGLITITLLISFITIAFIYFNAIREQEAALARKADEYTQYLAGVLQDPLWDYNERSINTICTTFLQNELVIRLVLKEPSGKIVFTREDSLDADLIRRNGKIHSHGELLGEIEISVTKRYVKEAGRRLLVSYALTMLFVSISVLLLTHLILRVFLKKPLEALDIIVQPYVAGIYDSPIPKLPYAEFQGFGTTLAKMGETIRLQMEVLHLQADELEQEVAERQMTQESLQEKALLLEEEIEKRQKAQEELERLNESLEERVRERTAELGAKSAELEEKNAELYKMNRLFVGRELRMVELKERIRELEEIAGRGHNGHAPSEMDPGVKGTSYEV